MQTPGYDGPLDGPGIERESFRRLDELLGARNETPWDQAIIRRIVHACADLSIADTLRIHPTAAEAGRRALVEGRPLVVDVAMTQAGVTRAGVEVHCKISDPEVRELAQAQGRTRAAVAMEALAPIMDGGIVAIGNAPTALFQVLELAQSGRAKPALVVGLPVGFVGAAESKQALIDSELVHISNVGPRGGSAMAAAAVNALATLVRQGIQPHV